MSATVSSTTLTSVVVLIAVLALTACQVKERRVGRVTVRADTPDTTLIALADVFSVDDAGAETKVGTVRTFEFDDDARNKVTRVYDRRDRPVGYITEDGKAYRVRAHDGQDLVSVAARLESNVASVLGMPGARLRIKPVELPDQQ